MSSRCRDRRTSGLLIRIWITQKIDSRCGDETRRNELGLFFFSASLLRIRREFVSTFENRLHDRPGEFFAADYQETSGSRDGCRAPEFFSWHARGACKEHCLAPSRGVGDEKNGCDTGGLTRAEDSDGCAGRRRARAFAHGAGVYDYDGEGAWRFDASEHRVRAPAEGSKAG